MDNKPSLTFVLCIEAGSLEYGVLLCVTTLRRFGGRFRHCPVIAVRPRPGAKISQDTKRKLDSLDVLVVRDFKYHNKYSWFSFMNKPVSLMIASNYVNTDCVCWLDSDILFCEEPTGLELDESIDFGAVADWKEQGTSGRDDPFNVIWRRMAEAVGEDIETLPWVNTARDSQRIRTYFNGGLFVYRHKAQFAELYLQLTMTMLDEKVRLQHPGYSIGFCEMSSIGWAAHILGFRMRVLPVTLNYSVSPNDSDGDLAEISSARLLHYHHSLWPSHYEQFLNRIQASHSDVSKLLKEMGPMRNTSKLSSRAVAKVFGSVRKWHQRRYWNGCRILGLA